MSDNDMCPYDGCPNDICGGPHFTVETEFGLEVLKEGQTPLGTPRAEMTADEKIAHDEAREAAGE